MLKTGLSYPDQAGGANNSDYHSVIFTSHVLALLLLILVMVFVLEFSNLDLWLADIIYQWSGSTWKYRDDWMTATLVHQYGRCDA